jgi:hypothetical protein
MHNRGCHRDRLLDSASLQESLSFVQISGLPADTLTPLFPQ